VSRIFEAILKAGGDTAKVAGTMLTDGQRPVAPGETSSGGPTAAATAPIEAPREAEAAIQFQPIRLAPDSPVLPFDGANPRASEQYRIIRTKILQYPRPLRLVMVSSPMPGDGKTISAINIAGALSLQEDVNVLLVDGDFRRSSLTNLMGLKSEKGLAEVVRGTVTAEEALIRTEQFPNLYILPAGEAFPGSAELLATPRCQALFETFRQQFRITVFDAPPVGTVADYELLQASMDGVVLVIRPEHTDRSLCRQALATVPKEKQIGVVLNCAEEWFLWKTNSYYYYGSKSSK
jgi:protein-tyrosine kinase